MTIAANDTIHVPVPAPARPKLEVKIKLNEEMGAAVIDVGGRALPNAEVVRDCMPVASRKHVRPRDWHFGRLAQIIYTSSKEGKINLQVWAQAILDAMVRAEHSAVEGSAALGGDDELVRSLAASAPAYILSGTQLFRIVPEGRVEGAGALKMMTKRNQELCARERENMLSQANADAQMLIRDAEQRKRQTEIEIEALRDAMASMLPTWMTYPAVRTRYDNMWDVGMWIQYQPAVFKHTDSFRSYSWVCPVAPPVRVLWWLPVNFQSGVFIFSSGHVDRNCPELPHTTWSSTCAGPQGLPKKVTCIRDLENIKIIAQRVFSEVNISSPLRNILDPSYPDASVRASIPVELRNGLANAVSAARGSVRAAGVASREVQEVPAGPVMVSDTLIVEDTEVEARQTWNT